MPIRRLGRSDRVTIGLLLVRFVTEPISRSYTLFIELAPAAANAPPTSVASNVPNSGSPRAASTIVGTVVTSSSSMILGFVSAT